MDGPTPGTQLREARLERGLSLEQIAARTKIRVPILQRLERDDDAAINGDVFVRGFLLAFAREVGLDGAAVAAQYVASHEPPPQPETSPEVTAALAAANRSRRGQISSIVAAVILAAAALLWTNMRDADVTADRAAEGFHTVAAAVSVDEVSAASSAPDTSGTDSVVQAVDRGGPLVIDIRVTGPLWLDATVDGERAVRRLLSSGEELQLTAGHDVSMLVGDAAAIRYAINGLPARPAGESGQVRTLRITQENFESFLSQ